MQYMLTVCAFVAAIAAALGETTRVVGGKKRLTRAGWIVVGVALVSAIASTAVHYREDLAKQAIQEIWEPKLDAALIKTKRLLHYLAVNATEYENVSLNDAANLPESRPPYVRLVGGAEGPTVTKPELFRLLGSFNFNPPRGAIKSWPRRASTRQPRTRRIDLETSQIAKEVLEEFNLLTSEYADLMDLDKRALVEAMRKSAFLIHLSKIDAVANAARFREDSEFYPVCALAPGIEGAPIESLQELLNLLELYGARR